MAVAIHERMVIFEIKPPKEMLQKRFNLAKKRALLRMPPFSKIYSFDTKISYPLPFSIPFIYRTPSDHSAWGREVSKYWEKLKTLFMDGPLELKSGLDVNEILVVKVSFSSK